MVREQGPFDNPTFFLPGKVVKNLSEHCPELSVDRLATILGDEHNMLLALPPRMRQALQGSRHDRSPFVSSQQPPAGELYAGNAQSSSCLTGKPVAYLLGLVTPATPSRISLSAAPLCAGR